MDVDYEAATYELTFSSDDMEMMALINITDDQVDEDSERFSAELSLPGNPSRVTLDPSTTNVDILDNDRKKQFLFQQFFLCLLKLGHILNYVVIFIFFSLL